MCSPRRRCLSAPVALPRSPTPTVLPLRASPDGRRLCLPNCSSSMLVCTRPMAPPPCRPRSPTGRAATPDPLALAGHDTAPAQVQMPAAMAGLCACPHRPHSLTPAAPSRASRDGQGADAICHGRPVRPPALAPLSPTLAAQLRRPFSSAPPPTPHAELLSLPRSPADVCTRWGWRCRTHPSAATCARLRVRARLPHAHPTTAACARLCAGRSAVVACFFSGAACLWIHSLVSCLLVVLSSLVGRESASERNEGISEKEKKSKIYY